MSRRSWFRIAALAAALVALSTAVLAQSLTLEEKERFLAKARIVKQKTLSEGITRASRATLSDGNLTHDAQIQAVDEYKRVFTSALGTEFNFRDTYRANIAAYRLDKLMGLNMTPPSVPRKVGGESVAMTWWVDDVLMTEKDRFLKKQEPPGIDPWNRQMYIVRVFDQLIYNMDRNLGNLVITNDWKIRMIDHTRAFRLHRKVKSPENLVRCDRELLEAMKRLDEDSLNRELKPFIAGAAVKAILARRDEIVKRFEKLAAQRGDVAVYYDYLANR